MVEVFKQEERGIDPLTLACEADPVSSTSPPAESARLLRRFGPVVVDVSAKRLDRFSYRQEIRASGRMPLDPLTGSNPARLVPRQIVPANDHITTGPLGVNR